MLRFFLFSLSMDSKRMATETNAYLRGSEILVVSCNGTFTIFIKSESDG